MLRKLLKRATSKARPTKQVGLLFAIIRRLNRRVGELEKTMSLLKRDVARIDRKMYREAEPPQDIPQQTEPQPNDIEQLWNIRNNPQEQH